MAAFILAFLFSVPYASTPQQAAKNVIYEVLAAPPVAVRTNVSGRFAAVRVNAREKGGRAIDVPVLLQRFSFGWEGVDYLTTTCAIAGRGIPKDAIAMLLAGMPKLNDDCFAERRDFGPTDDIEALRKMQPWGVIPTVVVYGNYAKADWMGPGGGSRIYRRTSGTWKVIAGGGGEHSARELRGYGIPAAVICKFHVSDATGC